MFGMGGNIKKTHNFRLSVLRRKLIGHIWTSRKQIGGEVFKMNLREFRLKITAVQLRDMVTVRLYFLTYCKDKKTNIYEQDVCFH